MTREIPLSRGLVALIDDGDEATVLAGGPWHARPSGSGFFYAAHTFTGGRKLAMHTLLTGLSLVDHRNGDGLDNRRENLRPATHAQNMRNRRAQRNSRSGMKGVSPLPSGFWRAMIWVDRRGLSLGSYPTPEAAARAYDAAALAHFGEFARLNFAQETTS